MKNKATKIQPKKKQF